MTVPISQNKVLTKMEKLALLMDYEIGLYVVFLKQTMQTQASKLNTQYYPP